MAESDVGRMLAAIHGDDGTGGGFAGFPAARTLSRSTGDRVDVTVLDPADHFLHLPLLPEVAGGVPEPRRIAVSPPRTLRAARLSVSRLLPLPGVAARPAGRQMRAAGVRLPRTAPPSMTRTTDVHVLHERLS
ncbi:hypothetical protein ACVGOW_13830 [Pseudonocardia saturnea]